MDSRQFILLFISCGLPCLLFALHKKRWVLAWVCITMSVHIFDTQLLTNLAAGRVVGLLYLPMAILTYRSWLSVRPAKLYLLSFLYLLGLGIIFGLLWPWIDTTGQRPFTLTAPGRVIVYIIRTLADLSLTIFIFNQLKEPRNLLFVGRMLILGCVITGFFGAISLFMPNLDFYNMITGLRAVDLVAMGRGRGLSFEPRGLGMACTYGILLLLIYPSAFSFRKTLSLFICGLGFVAAFSASSLALFVGGVVAAWTYLPRRSHLIVGAGIVLCLILSLVAYQLFPARIDAGINNIVLRLDPIARLGRLGGVVPKNFAETVAFQFDGFDGSALLFLFDKPQYALIGTGPTLVYLPASNYLLPGAFTAVYSQTGINSPPTLGLLLELSNGGIVTVTLWFAQIIIGYMALRLLRRRYRGTPYESTWRFGRTLFVVGTIFYLIQVSQTSPIWNLILAVGWSGVYHQRQYIRKYRLQNISSMLPVPSDELLCA